MPGMAAPEHFTEISDEAERPPALELVDEALALYDEWRQEVAAVDEAYRRWRLAPVAERRCCFNGYTAALDQEEMAALMYAVVAEELRGLLRRGC